MTTYTVSAAIVVSPCLYRLSAIDIVKYRESTDGLPEMDAAIIEMGREVYIEKKVSPETFARAHALFGPKALVNIVGTMNFYYSVGAQLHTFGLEMPLDRTPLLPEAW